MFEREKDYYRDPGDLPWSHPEPPELAGWVISLRMITSSSICTIASLLQIIMPKLSGGWFVDPANA